MKLIKTKLQNGFTMWYRDDDKFVGQRIALGKYEEYESQLILRQAQDKFVAVDIGANIGYYTLLLAKVCKTVYAFEPDKTCFEILLKNIAENKLKNVVVVNKAVSDKEEELNFVHSENNLGDHRIQSPSATPYPPLTLQRRAGKRDLKTIRTISLDKWWRQTRLRQETSSRRGQIDLIKIDTQGWEPKVILGAKKIIKKYKPILFLEYSPQSYTENNLDGKGMLNFLKQIYGNIWSIDYWFYCYKKGIFVDGNTGYADLIMGIKHNIFEQYRNLQWKKVIKKIFKVK